MSESQAKHSRRGFMWGAAAASAAAAAVATLPKSPTPETTVTETPPAPAKGGGYRLSEHVKQYYRTTLV
jgi:cobalamin biosynthesis protein CbiD